jgi:hypothetical protein
LSISRRSSLGYGLERGIEGGWLRYGSTTAPGSIWIAGASAQGPWLLSLDDPALYWDLHVRDLAQLHAALDRVYKLAVSLPEVPLERFRAKIKGLPAGCCHCPNAAVHLPSQKMSAYYESVGQPSVA